MEIKNLEQLSAEARKKVEPYVRELVKIYENTVVSVFAYGSVTGNNFNPATSDINLGVVLTDTRLDDLKMALKLVRGGMRKKINAPLFLTKDYLESSLDSFPIEFIEMKDTRCVLYGEDVLESIAVEKEDLRIECEVQIKGKILTIKQAYLEQALDRKGLEKLIKTSFRSLFPVLRNMVRLKSDVKPPLDKGEVLEMVGRELGIETCVLKEVLKDTRDNGKIGSRFAEDFLNDFVDQLEKLARIIDDMR